MPYLRSFTLFAIIVLINWILLLVVDIIQVKDEEYDKELDSIITKSLIKKFQFMIYLSIIL